MVDVTLRSLFELNLVPRESVRVGIATSTREQGRAVVGIVSGEAAVGDVVSLETAIALNADADDDDAFVLAPVLAVALEIWRDANLELGETVVVSGTGAFVEMLAAAARLWTPTCIRLGSPGHGEFPAFTHRLDPGSNRERDELAKLLSHAPGTVVLDATGTAEVVDCLLEAIPTWGRFVSLGNGGEPVTIDFYRNVHRKGIGWLGRRVTGSAIYGSGNGGVSDNVMRALGLLRSGLVERPFAAPSLARLD